MRQQDTIAVDEWISYCTNDPHATFFHTPYWTSLFTKWKPSRFTDEALRIVAENGDSAIVPIVKKRHLAGLIQIALSMPGTTYGGYVGPVKTSQLERLTFELFDRYSGCIMRENPLNPVELAHVSGMQVFHDVTHIIKLDKEYDAIWKQATAGHRNAVRNALKSNVQIRLAETNQDWDSYFTLYKQSISRWSKKGKFSGVSYDRQFFHGVEKLDKCFYRLFIASVHGVDIAGILCFVWKHHFVVWHGAGSAAHFPLHPNNLLYDYAIREALRLKCSIFDCNPSSGLEGVLKFKQYLGATAVPTRVFIRKNRLQKMVDKLRKRATS